MNKTLYDEAVADAHKLRELAEETAKNSVIDAVMPQIRAMVNQRILGEQLDDFDDQLSVNNLDDDLGQDVGKLTDTMPEVPEDDDDVESGNSIEIEAQGDVNIHLTSEGTVDDDLVLDKKMSEALRRLIKGEDVSPQASMLEQNIETLFERVTKLSEIVSNINHDDLSRAQRKRLNLSFLHCVREAIKLRSQVILTEGKTQEKLERRLTETTKEIKNMSKSNRRNIFDFLFEAEDEKEVMESLDEAELSLELTDEEQEELAGAEDPEAVNTALEDILGDLEVSMEAGEPEEGAELGADEPEAEEAPAEEEEIDLGEGSYGEMDVREADLDEEKDLDEVYDIDESMLRRELARMMNENEAVEADPHAQHDGEVLGDVLLDIDEDDLINVLADEIGNTDVPATPPMVAVESRRRSSRRMARQLSEARKENRQYRVAVSNLKKQLVEMNLFNAKLLYANKLMQNTNLTMKQQKAIVEALDNAKTLREAKLLYKSLTESLNRKSSKKLTEGSLRTLGSSSRSTRSAQPASSGVEVDRWGVLAGLASKD